MQTDRRTSKVPTTRPARDGSVRRPPAKTVSTRETSKERGISSNQNKNVPSTRTAESKINQNTPSKVKSSSDPNKSRTSSRDLTGNERLSRNPKDITTSTKPSVGPRTKISDTGRSGPSSSQQLKNVNSSVRKSISKPDGGSKVQSSSKTVKLSSNRSVPMKAVHSERILAGVDKKSVSVSNSVNQYPISTAKLTAQQDVVKARTSHRERTRTRTLSPSESMLMSSFGSLVPQDVATIDSAKEAESVAQNVEPIENEDDNYDDDFEDYESDFEEATESKEYSHHSSYSDNESDEFSSDLSEKKSSNQNSMPDFTLATAPEEKKMDSGHYDIGRSQRFQEGTNNNSKQVPVTKDANTAAQGNREISNTDEGFVDDKQFQQNIIDFSQARKIHQNKKMASSLNVRAKTLLQMIRLDSQSFSLFDEAPVPYDVYMRIYGRKNTLQAYSQTGEETLSEETQTDLIVPKHKWTQHPPNHSTSGGQILKLSQLACGSDPIDAEADWKDWKQKLKVDLNQLDEFVVKAGQLMLILLEESNEESQGKLRSNKMDLGFSSGFIALGVDSLPFLAEREVSHICFVPHKATHLITVHRSTVTIKQADKESKEAVDCLKRCIVCLWNIASPTVPTRLLVSSGDVVSVCVHPVCSSLVFCGLNDGVICAWDLKEKSTYHRTVSYRGKKWTLQPPTYSTAGKRGERGHSSAVVGIQALEPHRDDAANESDLKPTQVVSVDATACLIVWTVLRASTGKPVEDLGLACWGNIRLVHSASFNIKESLTSPGLDSLQCTSLETDGGDPAHFYVTTNTGSVSHFVAAGKAWPHVYRPAWESFVRATCISYCPFGEDYFLVGCDEGSVRVYKCGRDRPLVTVAGTGEPPGCGAAIRALQWSKTRPCVFFALDVASKLHVWDLGQSDMYPILSVPFKGKTISSMCLSPHGRNKHYAYLALGTSCGRIKVHKLSAQLGNPSPNQVAQELDKFVRYVSIL